MRQLTNQHGDVLLFKVDNIPGNLKKVKTRDGKNILAEGETTGHAHVIKESSNVHMFKDNVSNKLYLEVTGDSPVDLVHEEHKTQKISPGKYEIGIVKELDPFEDEIRNVAD